ncbi:MAG: sugar-binding protein [Oscillospiraceae bacterium]|jgi:putative multiple sugar transport system substrate-binding protein|nr:sugar-binding protein [Oscillospiraceae bacterium]
MKKVICTLVALTMVFLMIAACDGGGGGGGSDSNLIGISMPTQSSERWIMDGNALKDILTEEGFEVDLQFAEDDIPTQRNQIEAMLAKGAKVLVVAAIDGSTLSTVLDSAAQDGVFIISYDRLLVDTGAVSYYATFDNVKVGELQAQSLIDGLNQHRGAGPWNVELFAGSPDDTNSFFFWSGAMNVLQPYINSGDITVVSGQMSQEQAGTLRWDGAVAQTRMDAILAANYADGTPLHGVLSPYDGLSRGIISALSSFGFQPGSDDWPVVTGQDAEAASISLIRTGEQFSTILKDTRDLARVAASMVEAVLDGREPEINDTTTYHNNVKFVPSFLLVPYTVDISNYKELVIDSGYLKESDIH